MSLALDRTLSWTQVLKAEAPEDAALLALLSDLQGNILKGHGRDHTVHLFLSFAKTNADRARSLLRELGHEMPSALDQLTGVQVFKSTGKDAGLFLAAFLSADGYDALGLTDLKPGGDAFGAGMKQRQDVLADPASSAWEATFASEVHCMILLAHDDPLALEAASAAMSQRIAASDQAVRILGVEKGDVLRNDDKQGIEHFGYVDGRSQPLMLDEEIAKEIREGGIGQWNPTIFLSQVLLPCPGAALEVSCGSFLVFRKLEQNVRGFKQRELDLAGALEEQSGKNPGKLAGAYVVGRFENGTPVATSAASEALDKHPVNNNFNFDDDPEGLRCPYAGHIRKTNPRDDKIDAKSHLMARRGIPYGIRVDEINDDHLPSKPQGGVGLLFMAYQSSLENQFEFTQQKWANNVDFHFASPAQPVGIDPIIGQPRSGGDQCYPREYQVGPLSQPFDFSGFVTMKGGEYFFAPSLSFFKRL